MNRIARLVDIGVILFFIVMTFAPNLSYSQFSKAMVSGQVVDGITNRPLQGVKVGKGENGKSVVSGPDGYFLLELDKGEHSLEFFLPGFQKKIIDKVKLSSGQAVSFQVYLRPYGFKASLSSKNLVLQDSVSRVDSVSRASYQKYIQTAAGTAVLGSLNAFSSKFQKSKATSLYKDGQMALASNLNIQVIEELPFSSSHQFLVSGLGGRYNSLYVNGSPYASISPFGKFINADIFPTEIISNISSSTVSKSNNPGETVGAVQIDLKALPDRKFFLLQFGVESFQRKNGQNFFGDQPEFTEHLALPVFNKNIPVGFPGSRSDTRLADKNPQEKVSQLQRLPNNLSPTNLGKQSLGNRFLIGWGKTYKLKGNQVIGFTAYLNHQFSEQTYQSETNSSVNTRLNPYPFNQATARVVNSMADNINFTSNAHLVGYLSGAVLWNKSKISIAGIYVGQNTYTNTQRQFIFKPDEDSLAFKGIRSFTEQRRTSSIFLNGEHAMGQKGRFKFEWRVSYVNFKQNNPDDRSFLLRQDSVRSDFYRIATAQTLPYPDRTVVGRSALADNLNKILPNSGRSWKNLNDHLFSASADMSIPLNVFRTPQVLSGGLFMQSQNRVLFSDLLLYRGGSFNTLDGIISNQSYFPGGVEVDEYFRPLIGAVGSFNANNVMADNYANYLGSQNLGAAYINHELRLTKNLALNWGVRYESTSQLVSIFEYHFFDGFKEPEKVTLDENINVSSFDLLPSARLTFRPIATVELAATYFRSINRPLIQELTDYRYYNPDQFVVHSGNRLLTNTSLDNVRADINWKFGMSSFLSVAGFYKKIYKPIENVITNYAGSIGNLRNTPYNMPEATVYGVEVGFRMPLHPNVNHWMHSVSIYANGNINESKVVAGPLKSLETPNSLEHSLSGTPDFAIKAGFEMGIPKYPTLNIQYNRTGDYLTAVGSGSSILLSNGNRIQEIPNYYVKGRAQFDIQLSQRFFRNKLELIAGARNILEEPFLSYQDLNGNKKFDTPLKLSKEKATAGRFLSGIDNVVYRYEGIRSFYIRLTYTFQ